MARALFIRGGAIGDFILTLPILEALRAREPEVQIEILGYPHIADIAVGRRHACAVRRVDAAEWAPLFSPSGELTDSPRAWLAAFDRVICVWPDSDGVIGANLRAAGARRLLCVDPTPAPDGGHVGDHIARQCERGGIPLPWPEPHLYPCERDRWWAERFMRVTGAGRRPLLAMGTGSGSSRKNWPAERYAELARYWIHKREGSVLHLSGPADEQQSAQFTAAMGNEPELFALENEALPRVAAALERCEGYVGNDSGITHMAAAVRTPTLAIFTATDPAVWQPRAPRLDAVAADTSFTTERAIRRLEALLGRRV